MRTSLVLGEVDRSVAQASPRRWPALYIYGLCRQGPWRERALGPSSAIAPAARFLEIPDSGRTLVVEALGLCHMLSQRHLGVLNNNGRRGGQHWRKRASLWDLANPEHRETRSRPLRRWSKILCGRKFLFAHSHMLGCAFCKHLLPLSMDEW